ncbi:MAG: hypothetical protein IJE08_01835, partial [Clostridia bacterium]|nr:hypothetical protein [Clostridia bacterium]
RKMLLSLHFRPENREIFRKCRREGWQWRGTAVPRPQALTLSTRRERDFSLSSAVYKPAGQIV